MITRNLWQIVGIIRYHLPKGKSVYINGNELSYSDIIFLVEDCLSDLQQIVDISRIG